MYIPILLCYAPLVLGPPTSFVGKVQKRRVSSTLFLFPQECGACTANSLHDGHLAVQAEACLCMDLRMGIICILVFFCSYVLIINTYSLCGNEIPGPGQG